jgi:hypothetical protein
MKKSYLMIAAAAALFAACAKTDTFKDVETQSSAIAFDQAINKTTRAYIADKTDLADEGGFVVYGYKTLDNWSSLEQTVFNATNVTSSDGSSWSYANLRFWDKNGTYNFYAVAPFNPDDGATYGINVTDLSNSTSNADYNASAPYLKNTKFGYITITGAASHKGADSDDYLLARGGVLNELGSNHSAPNTNTAVTFDFHHVMTKVEFKLKSTLDVENATIKVTKLQLTGWNSNTGTFTQKTATNPTSLDNSEWTITAQSPFAGDFTLVGTDCTETEIDVPCDKNSAAANTKDVTDFCIMVPQNIAADQLKFTVDFTYYHDENATHTETLADDYHESFPNQQATVSTAQTWGTDSRIIYTIDVKPAAITFDVDEICGFDATTQNYGPVTVE